MSALPADVRRRVAVERRRRMVRRVVRRLDRVALATWLLAAGIVLLVAGATGIAYDALVRDVLLGGWLIPLFFGLVATLLGLGEHDLD